MKKAITDRIADLKAKQDALAAQLNNLENKAKAEDRKRDTRRKIIVGGAVLVAMEKDEAFAQRVKELLSQMVGRPIDRNAISDLLPSSPPPHAANEPPTVVDAGLESSAA